MQIIDNKALLLKLRHPKQVLAAIPESKPTGANEVAVKWDVPQVHALRSMNISAPSPIEGRYDWPGRYQPFDHQKKTAAFLTNNKRAFCFNEQGTGKTGAAIWAADFLMKRGLVRRALVICPMSIMDSAWRGDLFSFAMHRKVDVAHGTSKKRKQIIEGDAEFVVINFDGVAIVEKELAAGGFDLIIVDECFVAGTEVLTPSGPKPIETLSAGDFVWTSAGAARIKTVKSRVTADVVELRLSDGQKIQCTGDHPVFTDVGWVAARDSGGRRLFSPSEVFRMRENLRGAAFGMGVAQGEGYQQVCDLFEILRSEEVAPAEPGSVIFQPDEAGATWDLPRNGAFLGHKGENFKVPKGSGPQATGSGRKRHRSDADGDFGAPTPAPAMGVELRRALGSEAARLSDQLQVRLREPGVKNWVGDRRGLSHWEGAERAGPEEGGSVGGTWVDSVSTVECGSGTPVFNLEVEGTPNFYVGSGILVHNCTAYKKATTNRWKALNRLIGPDTWLWMMTGTPAAQGPEDAYGLAKLVNPAGTPRTFGSFRDSVMYKITQFKWAPKAGATETVHRLLQPAIRYTKDECLDLPDLVYVKRHVEMTAQQKKYYEQIRKHMVMEAAGEEVTAVNAAVKAGKLLQVACIEKHTPVMCSRGWVPIQDVTPGDRVWDGVEWVPCGGAVYKGSRRTMELDGIRMTPDHKVLTVAGWKAAEEAKNGNAGKGFDRADVRLPYGNSPSGQFNRGKQEGMLGVPVPVREGGDPYVPVPQKHGSGHPAALRMSAREQKTWDDQHPAFQHMGKNEVPVQSPQRQGLQELWGPGNTRLRKVGYVVPDVRGGHGPHTPPGVVFGSDRQQRPLLPEELQVGDGETTRAQHEAERSHRNSERGDDCCGGGRSLRRKAGYSVRASEEVRLACGESSDTPETSEVYDVLNCGPRSRFVVKGPDGCAMIVHNCGAVYTDDSETLEFDIKNRYNVLREVIDEASKKVIVFAPFQNSIEVLSERLKQDGLATEVINGAVSAGARSEIFRRFQQTAEPEVLVIQPQAAAHGVTLTAADTIVWWAPTSSLEIYAQANARIHRSGQTSKCTVVQLEGSPIERHIYNLLDNKIDVHSKIIDLYNELLD